MKNKKTLKKKVLPIFVKISATPFSSKIFPENNLHVLDIVTVPKWQEKAICKPEDQLQEMHEIK